MTMTSPRNTSTETRRGACAGRKEVVVRTGAMAGEVATVTMRPAPHSARGLLSSCHRTGSSSSQYQDDVNSLQNRIVEMWKSFLLAHA